MAPGRSSALDPLKPDDLARLSALAGGRTLRIPATLSNPRANSLKRLVGEELGILLVLYFGGSQIYVPNFRRTKVDDRAVAKLERQGNSVQTIATKLGCSDRTVYAARKRNSRSKPSPKKNTNLQKDLRT